MLSEGIESLVLVFAENSRFLYWVKQYSEQLPPSSALQSFAANSGHMRQPEARPVQH